MKKKNSYETNLGKVNKCSKNIDLKTFFKNFLWKREKITNFLKKNLYFLLKVVLKFF